MSHINELLERANAFADQLRWSEAADTCLQALEADPHNNDIRGELGWYLSRAKRYDEAISIFQVLIEAEPEREKWPYMLGYQYYDRQEWREAINWFARALELREDYLVVLYRKGYAHVQLGEITEAQTLLSKCVNLWRKITDIELQQRESKTYSDACFQLGKMLMERGQADRAVNAFIDAVKYDQTDAHKHYNLGKANFGIGRYDEALSCFKEADRLEPRKDYIQYYIARTLTAQGEFEQAERVYNGIPAGRRKAYIWQYMGEMYLAWGRINQALETLQTAIKLERNNHNTFYLLGRAYEGCGQIREAYDAYNLAVALRRKGYGKEFPDAQQRLIALEIQAEQQGVGLNDQAVLPPSANFVVDFNFDKGYGFIARDGEKDLFFHISNVRNPDAIKVGALVTFEIGEGRKGSEAVDVTVNDHGPV